MRKRTKKQELKEGAGVPAPSSLSVERTVRVRAMRSFVSPYVRGLVYAGQTFEIAERIAAPWLRAGLVEQDKMLTGAPEVK